MVGRPARQALIQTTMSALIGRGTRVRRPRGAPDRSGPQASSGAWRGGQPRPVHWRRRCGPRMWGREQPLGRSDTTAARV